MPEKESTYQIMDLMPDFWEFHAKSKDANVSEQAALFKKWWWINTPKHMLPGSSALIQTNPYDEALTERYLLCHERSTAQQVSTMQRISASIARDMAQYEAKFRKVFPDFNYTGSVYFMNSLLGFDGATRTVNGNIALLFGLDTMAWVYGDDLDLQPFFHHEIFHIYHSQFLEDDSDDVAAAIWQEGLAQFVAKSLNPDVEGVNLFGLPKEMPQRSEAMLSTLASKLLEVLDSTSRDDYGKFFFGNNGSDEIPPRSGYYLSYLVVQKLAKKYSLQEMAHSKLAVIKPEIKMALEELANGIR
ncbi:DUF2268 domain-containing putative Zn-dependent protease [Candidatus Villigracilis affinis]|uniref:DUF2268 domain-containing putative Zn-dependent protease n=1 Tax=Candidatus Villigracilis affinis TaxID=3140682 RepID=UPI001DFA2D14|nr:hypothetical protein [Anaerolineales bacterium]